jgi:Fe-S cluster assembly scaffold protein SufB
MKSDENAQAVKKYIIDKPGRHEVTLSEPGAEAIIVGSFDTHGSENVDVEIIIRHSAPHTRATTTLKGVARDSSRIKFTGRIIIDEKCGDSNSFLTERILLLSDQAKAEAIPELEILSDDVKCSHAASVSNIPSEHLFYLQTRGLSKKQAEDMIVEGFLLV